MKTLSISSRLATLALFAALAGSAVYAQGYYDDDIYYDASKDTKQPKESVNKNAADRSRLQNQREAQYYYDGAQYVPWNNVGDFQAADTYAVTGSSTRDVDEYNRRNVTAQPKELADSITLEQFEEMSNTRNLARFHDSQQAQEAYAENAAEAEYYGNGGYASPSQTVINLNVVDPYYSYSPYLRPWYWNSWGYYDPFWGPSWGYYPSWSWNWGWHGPGWNWAWGSPGWGGVYPGWGHGWGHGWIHSRPNYTSAGAFAPNVTNRRPSSGTYRNGSSGRFSSGNRSSAAGSLGTRPTYRNGANSVNRGNAVSGTTRPGYRLPIGKPNGSSSGYSTVGRGRTPRGSYGTPSNNSTQNRNNIYNNNSNTNSNRNSYNYNSGSRGRSGSSSGSFGGSRSGGSSRGSSGGGHRGR